MASHYRKTLPSADAALASEVFDRFCTASTMKTILGHFRHLCEILRIKPTNFPQFYPKLKTMLCSWKAKALWNKFDKKASHKCYNRGKACMNTRVLIIGSGPCGLRAAIEAQLLGAKVVVVEKRDRLSRHNVLHLWPFVIQDLKGLGAKKFFGKFCAGAIDHISIRQLQCILLKVSLILGVEIHEGVSFDSLSPPPDNDEKIGWRASISPADHPVSQYEFDVLIGADGKRNTLEGFKRKEFRGRLAIAITANFINKHTEAEARVEEISGVAFIFNQKFFKDLYRETGIDLENIVYYKDETHYFVMTAKKHSLIDKGVILNDYADVAKLLALENINKEALTEYAREAANFSTNYSLPQLEFAVNHYGQPDVAMFDFTSMYAAENSSHVIQRNGHKLLTTLVGDSLLEPFWPTGSGCARGFLSSMDACWTIRQWGTPDSNPLDVLAERESIYHILGQTTPENLHKNIASYTVDPHSRYPNLNTHAVLPMQIVNLFDCDDKSVVEKLLKTPRQAITPVQDVPKKRRRKESQVHQETLHNWLKTQVEPYDSISVDDFTKSFKNGLALCAIIHRYRPDLIDFFSLSQSDVAKNNQLAFDILEHEFGIPPIMSGIEMEQCDVPDILAILSYLSQVYDTFRREIPHIKHPKLEESDHGPTPAESRFRINVTRNNIFTPYSKPSIMVKPISQSRKRSGVNNVSTIDKSTSSMQRRNRKRRTNINNGSLAQIKKRLHIRMQQIYIREPEDDEFLENNNPEQFKERARELEKKLFPSPRDNRVQRDCSPRYKMEEDISVRAKEIEAKLKGGPATDKKPKDLLRAIGKIDKSDWNVKEIERKIEENKVHAKHIKNGTEKVPKWSRPQFDDKVSAIKKKLHVKGYDNDNDEKKYLEIDDSLNKLNRKIKDGNILDQGQRGANKVSAMAAHLATINKQPEHPLLQRSGAKNTVIIPQGGSETCHFCNNRVYLMERLSAEGRFFHRGCFRCEYCLTTLRLGNYMYDREGKYDNRFYCSQHFGMPGTQQMRSRRKLEKKTETDLGIKTFVLDKTAEKTKASIESLDRGETPERVEFENLDLEEDLAHSEMDEDEWTDRNFGASANEMLSSDELSEFSDSESDENQNAELNVDNQEQKLLPISIQNDNLSNINLEDDGLSSQNESDESQDRFSYKEFDSGDDESDTATEGEEEIKAREIRKKEVCLRIPNITAATTDTGSDTEVATDYYSTSSGNNSATEISTDSEFERDDKTPTKHSIPNIIVSESIQSKRVVEETKVDPLVPENPKIAEILNRAQNRPNFVPFANPGYELNRTQSTEGIATKRSLELKKLYLLAGNGNGMAVKKSGSSATLDTKFKSFVDQISEYQKKLNPAPVTNPTVQTFLQNKNPIVNKNEKKSKELSETNEFQHVCLKHSEDNGCNENNENNHKILEVINTQNQENDVESRPRSPVHETSIIVPEFHRSQNENKIESDSLSTDTSIDTENDLEVPDILSDDNIPIENHNLPKLEIHNSRGELMNDVEQKEQLIESECMQKYSDSGFNKIITVPSPIKDKNVRNGEVLKHVSTTADLFMNGISKINNGEIVYPDSHVHIDHGSDCNNDEDHTVEGQTETELSDWARDDDVGVSEAWDDFVPVPIKSLTYRKHQRPKSKRKPRNSPKKRPNEDLDDIYGHICGKIDSENIEFMDTISDNDSNEHVAALNQTLIHNTGYVEFVTNPQMDDELKTPVVETLNAIYNMSVDKDDNDTTTTSDLVTVMDLKDDINNVEDDILTPIVDVDTNKTYHEYVKRLQEKITPFNNIKDTIDIRKMKKTSKEEKQNINDLKEDNQQEKNSTIYKLQQITKERMKEKNLIHDMVMSKIPSKSPNDRKQRRNRSSPFSPESNSENFEFTKPLPVNQSNTETKIRPSSLFIPIKSPLSERKTNSTKQISCSEAFSLPDIRKALFDEKTPTSSIAEILKSTEEIREHARARARLKSDSELGISPEDKIRQLREKLERRRAVKSECDGLSLLSKSKSCQSIDEFDLDIPLCDTPKRNDQIKNDRPERKRSITQTVMAAIFQKKTPSPCKIRSPSQPTSPSRFKFLISGKTKEKSQSADNVATFIGDYDKKLIPAAGDKPVQYKSNSESEIRRRLIDSLAPPIPPLPSCYNIADPQSSVITDDEPKNNKVDDLSIHSADGKMSKSEIKIARQSQRKRLRIAQEIQRKLEELDVKLKTLEAEGVEVEKKLRGEREEENEDEPSLLHAYCELMSEVNRLRREERELGLQAQELEIEDNLARCETINTNDDWNNMSTTH